MKRHAEEGISFFQRYLTVWVLLCMAAGVLLALIALSLYLIPSIRLLEKRGE